MENMMKQLTNYEKVRAFHKAFGLDLDAPVTERLIKLRDNLIEEEIEELDEETVTRETDINSVFYDVPLSYADKITPNMIKELADVLYVVYGFAATFGINIDTAFNRVHESNMSKLGEDGKPIYREDGKALKGPNYKPPIMEDLVPKGN
jgi:predicted HAD superfamily Cof-like phosphohydrolase